MTLKRKKQNIKLIGQSYDSNKEEFLSVSFRYFTNNKNFNFEKLDKNQKRKWKSALTERLIELTQQSWIYWGNLTKEHGYETLDAYLLSFSPTNYSLSDDENITIFRFNSQKGRIIGVKKANNPTFYIIGIDTNFSAYDHGN